jgi:hypothetical protein
MTYIRNSLISLQAIKVNMADLVLVDKFIPFDASQFQTLHLSRLFRFLREVEIPCVPRRVMMLMLPLDAEC